MTGTYVYYLFLNKPMNGYYVGKEVVTLNCVCVVVRPRAWNEQKSTIATATW